MANLPKRDVKLIAHPHEEPTRQQFRERPAKVTGLRASAAVHRLYEAISSRGLTFGALDRCFISDRFDI